jgi:hypothetical protein
VKSLRLSSGRSRRNAIVEEHLRLCHLGLCSILPFLIYMFHYHLMVRRKSMVLSASNLIHVDMAKVIKTRSRMR